MRVASRRAFVSSFFALDDPPRGRPPVRRWLRLEERPRFLVAAELTRLRVVEADAFLFERVLVRARDVALVERALTGEVRCVPSAASSWKRAMFLALQMLRARRGVNRIV